MAERKLPKGRAKEGESLWFRLKHNTPEAFVCDTAEAIERDLSHDGFLCRYLGDDGLPGGEGTFLLCSFWLVDCLIGLGRPNDAELLLRKLERTANHLGLFSEQYGVAWREALGNFPQAFTHIGYINSVIRLIEARGTCKIRSRGRTKS